MNVAETVGVWWESLVEKRTGPHLSLFVPMARGGIAERANLTRWRQALRLAEARLAEAGASQAVRDELLGPAHATARMENALSDSSDGLAYYAAPGFFQFVPTPFPLHESARVGAYFHLRPLLPLSKATEHFYVLAVSQREVRLLECAPFAVRRLELPKTIATGFAEATGYEYLSQRQMHSASPATLGRRGPIVHGQGGNAAERRDRDLEHHFRRLWEALAPLLPEPSAPIVLAAIEDYLPLVTAALRDGRLVDRCVAGSPDRLSDEELWHRALPVATEWRARERARRLRDSASGGRPTLASGLARVLPAAEAGRVAHLLLGERLERWGKFDEQRGLIEDRALPAPGDEDLFERAILATLARGGEVESVPADQLPNGEPAAAWLRF